MNVVLYWEGRRIDDVRKFCQEHGYDIVWVQDYRHVPPAMIPANDEARWAEILEKLLDWLSEGEAGTVLEPSVHGALQEMLAYFQARAEYLQTEESEEPVGPPYLVPAPFVDHQVPTIDERGIYTRVLYREKCPSCE